MTQTTPKKARAIAPEYNGKWDRRRSTWSSGLCLLVLAIAMVHSDDRLASAITTGRQEPVSNRRDSRSTSLMHSARQVILITAELDRRPTGQHAINFCRAPQKAYTPFGTRRRAPCSFRTCNGSLTVHIVR